VLPGTTVGHLVLCTLVVPQVDSAYAIAQPTAGLVLDLRGYPSGATLSPVAEWHLPNACSFATATDAGPTYPV
jgi:hypothetical protein